ncbi:MAG: sigma 54-interacting transcriptional regulator [bacterium]
MRYSLGKEIGRGTFGRVCEARDSKGNTYAVKLADTEEAGQLLRQQFELLSGLDHRRIVRAYDFGIGRSDGAGSTDTADAAMMATELVAGPDLRTYVRENGVADLPQITAKVLDALRYLHSLGRTHGDIKPGSILICRTTGDVDIRLVDVGFAPGQGSRLPAIFGTPEYMAPEIIRDAPADGRADLYSLGVTLYEVLTGTSPFAGGSREEILTRQLEHAPVPPGRLVEEKGGKGIDPGWDVFIGMLLKKEPVLRYRDASHAGLALESALAIPGVFVQSVLPPGSTPLVERDAQIEAIGRLVSSSDGGGLLLSGERGSGISRLIREAGAIAMLGGLNVHSISLAQDMPGIAQIVSEVLGLEEGVPEFGPPARSAPSPDPSARLDDLLQVFESRLSGDGAHMILIDRGEVLEPIELKVLGALVKSSDRLKMVIGYQDAGQANTEPVPEESLEHVEVMPLGRDGVERLVEDYLGQPALPPGLSEELYRATEGRPGSLHAALSHMWSTGSLAVEADGDTLRVTWDGAVEVPASVGEAARPRLKGLSDSAMSVLKVIGAGGGWIETTVLSRVLPSTAEPGTLDAETLETGTLDADTAEPGTVDADTLETGIDELLHRNLVKRDQTGTIHLGGAGILDLVRGLTPPGEAETLSRRIAAALESSARHISDYYRLGLLHLEGGEPGAAFPYLAGAGDYLSRFSARDALLAYGRALECGAGSDVDPGLIAATEEKIADLKLSMGDFAGAESVLKRAAAMRPTALRKLGWVKVLERRLGEAVEILARCRDGAAERSDEIETAHVLSDLGYALTMHSKREDGLVMLRQAARLFEAKGMARETGTARNRIGLVEMRAGNYKSAARIWESARKDFERAGYARGAAVCLMNQGLCLRKQMDFEKADECFVESLRVLEQTWWVSERATCQQNYGLLLLDRGNLGLATEIVSEALKTNRMLGKATGVLNATILLCAIDLEHGNWKAAEDELEATLAASHQDGPRDIGAFHRAMIKRYQALARSMAGDTGAAEGLADESLDLAREAGDSEGQGQAILAKSAILLRAGRAREAVEQARLAAASLTFGSSLLLANEARRLLGEALCELGDMDSGIAALVSAREGLECLPRSLHMGRVLRSLANAYCLARDFESFNRYLRRSLEIFRAVGARYDSALAILLGGEVAVRRGSLIQARHYLREAERVFDALGIDDLREKAGKEMSKIPTGEHEIRAVGSLSRISQVLNSSRDLTTVLHLAMDLALEYLGAERGVLILSDEATGELTTFIEREMDRESLDEVIAISRSIVDSVRSTGLPVVASDATQDPRFKDSRSVRMHNIMSVMCIPLKMGDDLLGVIYLDSRGVPAGFSDLERAFVEAFSNQVALAISNARFVGRLYEDVSDLRARAGERYNFDSIIGPGKKMQEVFRQVDKAARSDISVLITGDSGTGKELIAGLLHELSPRRDKPLVEVNCAAIQRDLLEAELFGIEKHVATGVSPRSGFFERAEGGTIFLDEIGDMPLATQRRVLRVLQEMEFERVGGSKVLKADVRVISATNQDLKAMIAREQFRKDLYYRLNRMRIHLPSLRERMGDLPFLVDHFLAKYTEANSKPAMKVLPEAMSVLRRYSWPGNVRELEHCIEHAVVVADGLEIGPEHLSDEVLESRQAPVSVVHLDAESSSLPDAIRLLEKRHILRALEASDWVQTAAARSLGIHESTLRKKMKQLSIEREQKTG